MLKSLMSLAFGTLLLTGCASGSKPLYNWDSYQQVVYQHYQQSESDPQAQIDALKKSIELSRAKSLGIPPGLHAHLGMLYGATGALDLAMAEFNEEKALYPESAEFMDRLMKNKGMQK
ncbi:DUF4810 domain-containing protein [Proteus vulgaris]|uniref:DUF4810 domain-containing protein n=1 Tax=Proteus sp. fly-1008 TaxID=3136672 RepID=UPI0030FC12F0